MSQNFDVLVEFLRAVQSERYCPVGTVAVSHCASWRHLIQYGTMHAAKDLCRYGVLDAEELVSHRSTGSRMRGIQVHQLAIAAGHLWCRRFC